MIDTPPAEIWTSDTAQLLRARAHRGELDWALAPEETLAQVGLPGTALDDPALADWYGPLEPYLHDPTVSDVFFNGPGRPVVTVQAGARLPADLCPAAGWIGYVQRRLLLRAGLVAAGAPDAWPAPWLVGVVDRRLRFAAARPPAAPGGPALAVRMLPRRWRTLDDLVKEEFLPRDGADLLVEALRGGASLVVAGGARSGRTTLVAALVGLLGDECRVAVVEDGAELPEPSDGIALDCSRGELGAAVALRFALRLHPDALVLGEARGGEALVFLQAVAAGLTAVTTVLAADVQAALRGLERMACAGGEVAPGGARALLSGGSALLVAYVGRFGGRRRLGRIEEVLAQGVNGQPGDRYPTHVLAQFDERAGCLRREGWVQGDWGRGRI